MEKATTIDQYIQNFPEPAQQALQQVRQAIQQAIPQAEEGISYNIPAFKVDGKFLVYFSGAKKHIGLYPFSQDMVEAMPEASNYDQSGKGTIRFPFDKPMPLELIKKIAVFKLDHSQSSPD